MLNIEKQAALPYAAAKELLQYDPATGEFIWLVALGMRVRVGSRAGGIDGRYVSINIRGQKYRAHRLAYLLMDGQWPPDQIDHINRNGYDNRWSNLRCATQSQNNLNRSTKVGLSGFRGVRVSRCGNFEASARLNGKRIHLGTYANAEAAGDAYKQYRNMHP